MNKSIREMLLCSTAAISLFAFAPAAHASGGQETNWATIDNHGFLGIDLMLEGGYSFGSGDLPYAQYYDYDGNSRNDTFRTDPGNGWNGSVGITGKFEGGWTTSLIYTGIRTSRSGSTPNYNYDNTGIDFPVDNILGPSSTSYNQITVSTKVKADSFDLNVGHDVGLGSAGNVTLIGGVRYGVYQQNTTTSIFDSDPNLESTETRSSRYQGVGPELGANYTVPFSDSGFGFFASALGSLLYGKQTTDSTGAWDETTSYTNKHFAYTADAKAGFSYKLPDHPLQIMAGYSVSWLGRVRDSANESSYDGDTTSVGSRSDNLLYHGPFVRLVVSLP